MKVLVTGSSNGIGKAIAEKFLNKGFEVVGFDLLPSSIINVNYTHYIFDITSRNYPDIGNINFLINNAGVQQINEKDIEINLTSTIALTEHYAFQKNIKSVVNIASSSALTGSEFPHYAASKGGLVAYSRNLALRLAKYGATCNALCPGGVITDLNKHIINDEKLYKAVLDETLLNKWALTDEIAEWTYFLAIINKSMTGESLMIDNGESIKSNFIW